MSKPALEQSNHDPIIAEVHACAGPPVCSGSDGQDMAACLWCKHIFIHEDGREFVREPSVA